MNIQTVYGIYSQLNDFLADDPPAPTSTQNRIENFKQTVSQYGEDLKSKIRGRGQVQQTQQQQQQQQQIPSPQVRPQTNTSQQTQPQQPQQRSNSLWGKIERTWDDATNKNQNNSQISEANDSANKINTTKAVNNTNRPAKNIFQEQMSQRGPKIFSSSNDVNNNIQRGMSRSPVRQGNNFQNVMEFQKRFEVVSQIGTNKQKSQNEPKEAQQMKQPPVSLFYKDKQQPQYNQQQLTDRNLQQVIPSNYSERSSNQSFNDSKLITIPTPQSKPNQNVSLDSFMDDDSNNQHQSLNRTLFLLEKEKDTSVDDVFYQDDAESKVLQQMIQKLGSKPNIDKVGLLLEKLQKKDNYLKQQIGQRASENQHLFGSGFVLVDGIVFRVNSCFARIQRSRESLKMIKQNQVNLGTKIQTKLKLQKQQEQNLLFLKKFSDRYQLIFKLMKELLVDKKYLISKESWTLDQIKVSKEKVFKGLSDRTEKQFMDSFNCFTNIRSSIDYAYRKLLENSYEFFNNNIIRAFLVNDGQRDQLSFTICRMADILYEFQLEEKAMKLNIATALRRQFKTIFKSKNYQKPPFQSFDKLISYLKIFLLSFQEFAYSLNNITQILTQTNVRQSQTCKQISSDFQKEKQSFWNYIQNKLIKVMKSMKFQTLIDCDLWNFLILMDRIIKIGEELSSQSSERLLQQLSSSLKAIIQVLGFTITEKLQSGIIEPIRHTRFQTPQMFTLNFSIQKRIQQKSNYLNKQLKPEELLQDLLTSQKQIDPDMNTLDADNFKTKNYHLNVIQQLQRLQVVGEALPYLAFECFLFALNSFDVFCLMQLKCNAPKESFALLMKQITVRKNINLEELAQCHSVYLHQREYSNLRQLIFRSNNLIQSKSDNIPALSLDSPQSVFDFLRDGFSPICDDKKLLQQQIEKQTACIKELRLYVVKQNAWSQYTLDSNVLEQAVMQFRIAKQFHLLGQPQWIVEISAQTLIQKMIIKAVPYILSNKQHFLKVMSDIHRMGNINLKESKDPDGFIQHFVLLLERFNVNIVLNKHQTSLILQNKQFPLLVSMFFIDTKNPQLVKQIIDEYTNYIQNH